MCGGQGCFCPTTAGQRLVRSPHAAPAAEERLSKQRISLPHRMTTHVLAQRAAQQTPWQRLNAVYQSQLAFRRTGECEQWQRWSASANTILIEDSRTSTLP